MLNRDVRPSRRALLAGLSVGASAVLSACAGVATPFGGRGTPPVVRVGLITGDFQSAQATAKLLPVLLDLSKQQQPSALFSIEPVTLSPAPTPAPGPNGTKTQPELASLAQALGSGGKTADTPDVVLLVYGSDAVYAGAKGLVRPLDPYLETTAGARRTDFYAGALAAVTARGHTWGVPLTFSPSVLSYDPTLFAQLGLTPPAKDWFWPQFTTLSTALTSPLAKRYALGPFDYLPTYVYQGGGRVLTADGTHCALTQPGAIAGLAFYQDLAHRYKVVAPSGPCRNGPPFNCGGNVIAWQPVFVANSMAPRVPGSITAPPLTGKVTATSGTAQYILAVTNHAADPARAYAAIVAIADAAQPTLAVPSRRTVAQRQPTAPLYFSDQAHQMALAAAEVAVGEPLDLGMDAAIGQQEDALRSGQTDAQHVAAAAAAAIERVLADQYAS